MPGVQRIRRAQTSMSWSFTVPGQPVSWDAAYRTGTMPVKRRGVAVLNEDMTPRMIRRPILTDEARAWRDAVVMLARLAKPSRWKPRGHLGRAGHSDTCQQIRLVVDLRLAADMDDDNALKLLRDGLAEAIDYDDIHFLTYTQSKTFGRSPYEACVIVTVEDLP